jgi:CubicO group peptidase (beta-lactamase class C family)
MLSYLFQRLAEEKIGDLWGRELAAKIGIPDGTWNWTVAGEIEGVEVTGGASGMEISARQLARFGHLYLNKGLWNGKRVLSENWVERSTLPQVAPHTRCHQKPDVWYSVLPGRYGYNWWLNGIGADGERLWPNAPDGTYFAQGNRNNYCIVVPEWDMVIVHLDRGKAIKAKLYDKVFAVLREAVSMKG